MSIYGKDYRDRVFLIGEVATRWAAAQGGLEHIFGVICNAHNPAAATAAISELSSGSVQFRLVEVALKKQLPPEKYPDLNSEWKVTRRKLEAFLKLRNDLAHSVTVGKPTEGDLVVIQSLPSLFDIDNDMAETYRSKFQGKPADFDFTDYAMSVVMSASHALYAFRTSVEEAARVEIRSKAELIEELRKNAPPLKGDEILF